MHVPAVAHLDTTLVKHRLRRRAGSLPASPFFTHFSPLFPYYLPDA